MTDFEKKMKALEQVTDQKKLAKIAMHDDDIYVSEKALEMLTDQDALEDVAKNSESDYTRMDAAKRLDNKDLAQRVYADIAGSTRVYNVREAAFGKLTDRALLCEVAKNGISIDGRMEALKRLGDDEIAQQVCTEIAQGTDDWPAYARLLAVRKLTDQKILAKIAKSDDEDYIRKAAIYRLTDQAVLEDIATNNDEYADISWWVADKLENRELAQLIYKAFGDAALWDYYNGDDGKIYKRRFDGSDEREWTVSEAVEMLDGSFTEDGSGGFEDCSGFITDGRWIYFTYTYETSRQNIVIYRMRPDGSDLASLYELGTDEEYICINKVSDGWVYFTQGVYYNWGTKYKMRTDGSDRQEIEEIDYTDTGDEDDYDYDADNCDEEMVTGT